MPGDLFPERYQILACSVFCRKHEGNQSSGSERFGKIRRKKRLPTTQLAFGTSDGHAFTGPHPDQVDISSVGNGSGQAVHLGHHQGVPFSHRGERLVQSRTFSIRAGESAIGVDPSPVKQLVVATNRDGLDGVLGQPLRRSAIGAVHGDRVARGGNRGGGGSENGNAPTVRSGGSISVRIGRIRTKIFP